MIEHEVVEVDGLVVECWRDGDGIVAASREGVSYELFTDPFGWATHDECAYEYGIHNGGGFRCTCHWCEAFRAHRRLKEQR